MDIIQWTEKVRVVSPREPILRHDEKRANFIGDSISISRNPIDEIPSAVTRIVEALSADGVCCIADDDAADFYFSKLVPFLHAIEGLGLIHDVSFQKIDDKTKGRLVKFRRTAATMSMINPDDVGVICAEFFGGLLQGTKSSTVDIGQGRLLNVSCPAGKASKARFPAVYGIFHLLGEFVGYCGSTGGMQTCSNFTLLLSRCGTSTSLWKQF
jgi:hypothetical protein